MEDIFDLILIVDKTDEFKNKVTLSCSHKYIFSITKSQLDVTKDSSLSSWVSFKNCVSVTYLYPHNALFSNETFILPHLLSYHKLFFPWLELIKVKPSSFPRNAYNNRFYKNEAKHFTFHNHHLLQLLNQPPRPNQSLPSLAPFPPPDSSLSLIYELAPAKLSFVRFLVREIEIKVYTVCSSLTNYLLYISKEP